MIKAKVETINDEKVLTISVEGLEVSPGMTVSLDEEQCDHTARQLVEAACDLLRVGRLKDMGDLSLEVFHDALSIPEVDRLYKMMVGCCGDR